MNVVRGPSRRKPSERLRGGGGPGGASGAGGATLGKKFFRHHTKSLSGLKIDALKTSHVPILDLGYYQSLDTRDLGGVFPDSECRRREKCRAAYADSSAAVQRRLKGYHRVQPCFSRRAALGVRKKKRHRNSGYHTYFSYYSNSRSIARYAVPFYCFFLRMHC